MDNQQELEKTLADVAAAWDGIAEQIDYLERKTPSIRERFAGMAMGKLIEIRYHSLAPKPMAQLAVEYADGLIEALARSPAASCDNGNNPLVGIES